MSNLYVYEQGSVLGLQENRLVITQEEEVLHSIPIETVDNVVLFGRIQVSTPCIQTFLSRGIHLTWLSKTGSYFGRLESTSHIHIERQRQQFRRSDDPDFRLAMAKQFIFGKASNQRAVLQRYQKVVDLPRLKELIEEMASYIRQIERARNNQVLLGIEGYLARLYYQGINTFLEPEFAFERRTKQPPKDPFNAVLSFGYTLLHYEIFTLLITKGLNPYAAFLHADRAKHPALCSDLMEEWRPILVDSLAISLLNNRELLTTDFEKNASHQGVLMTKEGCRKFVEEFEKRLRQEVSYITKVPYKMSFRKIIEYQVLQLVQALETGRAVDYEPVLIR